MLHDMLIDVNSMLVQASPFLISACAGWLLQAHSSKLKANKALGKVRGSSGKLTNILGLIENLHIAIHEFNWNRYFSNFYLFIYETFGLGLWIKNVVLIALKLYICIDFI